MFGIASFLLLSPALLALDWSKTITVTGAGTISGPDMTINASTFPMGDIYQNEPISATKALTITVANSEGIDYHFEATATGSWAGIPEMDIEFAGQAEPGAILLDTTAPQLISESFNGDQAINATLLFPTGSMPTETGPDAVDGTLTLYVMYDA